MKPKHANKLAFVGVLAKIDHPSDKAPNGSRGHRVVLSREAAEDALWSLEGMAVSYKEGWDGHNAQYKVGIIERPWIDGDDLKVSGYIFGRDFPQLAEEIKGFKDKIGMSYELIDAHVKDMRNALWVLSKVTFTGAAILLCDRAAYAQTSFVITAAADNFTGRISFIDADEVTGPLKKISG